VGRRTVVPTRGGRPGWGGPSRYYRASSLERLGWCTVLATFAGRASTRPRSASKIRWEMCESAVGLRPTDGNGPSRRWSSALNKILPAYRLFTLVVKMSSTLVADISSNYRPTFSDGRPITASVTQVSHAHPPSPRRMSASLLTCVWHV